MEIKKGKIIAVTSTKGGVGKTIITLNLAAVFAKQNKKVLVLDFNIYGGAVATYLNSNNDKTLYTLVDDLNNNRYNSINDYLFNYSENISILAAPKDPRQASKIETKYVNIILNTVISLFDVILIDTTHILNDLNIITFDSSDSLLYVFTNDAFDLKNTKSFISILQDANNTKYYTLLNTSILPNRNYFSLYEIKDIIKNNIDFTIGSSFNIKNIDKYIMEGKILLLNKNLLFNDKKDYKKFENIANTLIGNDKIRGDKNE